MELLTVALLILIIALIIVARNGLGSRINDLENQILDLKAHIRENLHKTVEQEVPKPNIVPERPPVFVKPPPPVEVPKPKVAEPPPVFADHVETHKEVIRDPMDTIRRPAKTGNDEPKVYFKQALPKSSFWERNPDLEKFIGENLINKIGIAILVLAIGYFVKYAIDKDWIYWSRRSRHFLRRYLNCCSTSITQ